jgi:NAD(P)-dependent dehydrogenase (short-subunit alcohol dehydrogenase family)
LSDVRGLVGVTHLVAPPNSDFSFGGVTTSNRTGRTEHFEVFYDRVLGESGRAAGGIVLNRAERDLATVRDWFASGEDNRQFVVVLARLPDHSRTYRELLPGDNKTMLFCDVQTTPRLEALQSCFFVAFQLADLFAAAAGWDEVDGGALARVLATSLYPRRIAGFETGWVWMEGDREDPDPGTDPAPGAATGRAVLFLNYLHYQLGHSWKQIAAAPAPTLGAIARRLTGSDDHVARFQSLLAKHHPIGRPMAHLPDNPFPLSAVAGRRKSDGRVDESQPGTRARPIHRRVCLLTGASGTLGSALCDGLADSYEFAAVHHDRRPASSMVFAIEADLREPGECERIVEAALERFGRIDLIVNAAVSSRWGSMLESAPVVESAPSQFLLNTVVPLRVACAAARLFWVGSADENRILNRSVINVSSISGQNLIPGEGQSVYAASKAALDHLTGHMALEFASIGIRVNAVAPNSFPRNVATGRVVQAIENLDLGEETGSIVVVDGEADYVVRLVAPV